MHPDIDVRLNASAVPVDLATGEADFDIRYGNVFPDTGVTVEPFPAETIVVTCSPALFAAHKTRKKTFDISKATMIQTEVNKYTWRDWARDHPEHNLDLERGPRFDRTFMAINCAVDGLGVALESLLMLERELESKKLVLPFGLDGPTMVCHQLLYLKTKGHVQKMRAFREWLFEELSQSIGTSFHTK